MTNDMAAAIKANEIAEKLAVLCGVRKSEMISFINCLSVWTSEGYSLEVAIEKNMRQMQRFVGISHDQKNALVPMAVDWFYPEAA